LVHPKLYRQGEIKRKKASGGTRNTTHWDRPRQVLINFKDAEERCRKRTNGYCGFDKKRSVDNPKETVLMVHTKRRGKVKKRKQGKEAGAQRLRSWFL